MPSRRLPNGRFAKFTQLPDPKTKASPKGAGGYVLVRTNSAEAARKLATIRLSRDPQLLRDSQDRAQFIEAKMRAAALAQYHKTGTGRFARSIRASVSQSTSGDRSETIIKVSAGNFRETKFLTNIGGAGFFRRFKYPVAPYDIWARGARRVAEETPVGVGVGTRSNLQRTMRNTRVGRLKVPRASAFFTSSRGSRGGGERRVINDALGPMDQGDRAGAFFFYPIRVTHPGFERDVISDIAQEEGAQYITYMMNTVGRAYSGSSDEVSNRGMAVIDEIPLTKVLFTGRAQSRPTRFS